MTDLNSQLRSYLDETAPPVAHETVLQRVGRRPRSRGITCLPGWLLATAVAALVLLLFGGAALLFSSDPSTEPVDEPPERTGEVIYTVEEISVPGIEAYSVLDGGNRVWVIGTRRGSVPSDTDLVVAIDPIADEFTSVELPFTGPAGVFANGMLWVWPNSGGTLVGIDPAEMEITHSVDIPLMGGGGQLWTPVVHGDRLWLHTNSETTRVVEIDLATATIVSDTAIGGNAPWWAAMIDGGIWSFNPWDGLKRFDVQSLSVEEFRAAGFPPMQVSEACCVHTDTEIFLINHNGIVERFDLASHEITHTIELPANSRGGDLTTGVVAGGALWLPYGRDDVVLVLDTRTLVISDRIPVGQQPQRLFQDGEAVWVPESVDRTLTRIDVETRSVTQVLELDSRIGRSIAIVNGSLWLTVNDPDRDSHGEVMRVVPNE